ncbi:MAG: DUF4145 domain-containing protein [Bacteroidota bacterium]
MLEKKILIGNFEKMPQSIKCPSCISGLLLIDASAHKEIRTAYSEKNYRKQFIGFDEKYQSICSECFHCNNSECNESSILTGTIEGDLVFIFSEIYGHDVPDHEVKISIKHIEPALDIIDIPNELPENLKNELRKAFYIFWADKDACANRLGIFIELLLNNLELYPGKKLHDRLELMQKSSEARYTNLASKLMAIKWIRNDGSHIEKRLTHDVIDALEILENALKALYDNSEDLINKKVKEINKIFEKKSNIGDSQ